MYLKKSAVFSILFFSLFMQGFTIFSLYRRLPLLLDPFDKNLQTMLLIIFSAAVTFLYCFSNIVIRFITVIIHLLSIFFLCKVLSITDLLFAFLLVALVTETLFFLPFPFTLCICFIELLLVCIVLGVLFDPPVLFVYACCLFEIVLVSVYVESKKERQKYSEENNRLENALNRISTTNLAYQNYVSLIEEKTMQTERNRITREIHDIIGYTMTNVLMLIQAALHSGKENWSQAEMLLLKAQIHSSTSVDDARLALRRLRDREVYQSQGANLFLHLIKTFSDVTSITIYTDFGNMPYILAQDVEKMIYRMLQEGMTNSFRHGKATTISVSFWCEQNTCTIRIRDNGQGSAGEIKEGIGIQGMRERIEQLGGIFSAESVSDGFIIQAVIPMGEPDE